MTFVPRLQAGVVGAVFLASLAGGCAGNLDVSTAQQRLIESAAPDAVFDVATELLRREFGRVSIDRAAHRIDADPVEFTADRESGTARDLVAARSRMRRVANLALVSRDNGALVRLRVDIEREDTSRRTATREEAYGGDDRPGFTPIERDAATNERQNRVWKRVRRDRALERQLLDELADRFAPDGGPPRTVATAPSPAEDRDAAPTAAGPPDVRVRPTEDAPPAARSTP